jgi:hypothetical protein
MSIRRLLKSLIFSLTLVGQASSIRLIGGINLKPLSQRISGVLASLTLMVAAQPSFALDSMNINNFINLLDSNAVDKVVFKGVNPKYIIATLKENGKEVEVREGFPSYDDPLSEFGL